MQLLYYQLNEVHFRLLNFMQLLRCQMIVVHLDLMQLMFVLFNRIGRVDSNYSDKTSLNVL